MSGRSALVDLLKRATLQVQRRDGQLLGTGFRISDRLVLTAAHVLAQHHTSEISLLGADGARVVAPTLLARLPAERPPRDRVWPPPDLALLSVGERAPAAWQVASVCGELPAGSLVAVGYVSGLYDAVTLDPVALEYEGTRTEADTTIFKLSGGRIDAGMSGAPVLDTERGLVVGFVKADRGFDGGGFIVSLDCMKKHVPEAWGEATASASRNAGWNTTRRLGVVASLDADLVDNYVRSVVEVLSRRSTLLAGGIDREQLRQPVRLRQITDQNQAALRTSTFLDKGIDNPDDPETFIWDPTRSAWRTVGIVAAPGMGKSWMLAFHVRTLAANARNALSTSVSAEVQIPVLVEAANYARILPDSPNRDDARSALARASHRMLEGELAESECEVLFESALANRRLVLCIDGLDEVSMDLRPRLATAVSLVGPQIDQLIVSARDSARQALQELFPRGYTEFRIDGFTIGDTRRFVQAWHRGNPAAVDVVARDLRAFPHLRSLARVPLLLGFICRLATGEGIATPSRSLPSTRPSLYRAVALGLLSGRWRESSARRAETQSSDPVLRLQLLSRAVGHLAAGWRQRPDVFYRSDLQVVLRQQPSYGSVAMSAEERWKSWQAAAQAPESVPPDDFVLWEYQYDGFLVPDVVENRPALGFIHQVFAELCLALDLASRDERAVMELIEEHRWFDDEWADVFPVACGTEDSQGKLLRSLSHPDDDPWLTQCELESQCVAELVDNAAVEAPQLQRLLDRLCASSRGALQADAQTAVRSLERLVEARVVKAVAAVENLLSCDDLPTNLSFRLTLRLAAVGSSRGVEGAIAVVRDQFSSTENTVLAVSALAQSSRPEAIEFLTKQLGMTDEKGRLPLAAAMAHGDQMAADAAISIARRTDLPMPLRSDVIVALVESGVGEDAALELVLDDTVSWVLKCRAMVALLRVGAGVAEQDVEALIRDPNVPNSERIELVRALLLRGDIALLPVAADLVVQTDIYHPSRYELARTMISISDLGVEVARRVGCDARVSAFSRLQTLRALVEHRDEVGVEEAVRLVMSSDEPRWLRVVLFEDLLERAPSALSTVDLDMLLAALAAEPDGYSAERTIGKMIRCRDLSISRYGQDRFHEALVSHATAAGGILDTDKLIGEVATAGATGVGLLLALALDSSQEVHTRVTAALAGAQSNPRQAEALGEFLEDRSVPEPVRSRLTVALGMLGCRAAFHRLLALRPLSEPAYVALGSLLSSPNCTKDMLRLGLAAGIEAQAHLIATAPPVWELDYGGEIRGLQFPAASEAERELRNEWGTTLLRQRADARLLSLLLPVERAALYRVARLRESPETRNWLARWIPEYKEIVQEEVERLRLEVEADPSLLPLIAEAATPLRAIANMAGLLDEWVEASRKGDWLTVRSLLSAYEEVFGSELSRRLLVVARQLGQDSWPLYAAHQYLAHLASQDRTRDALRQVERSNVLLDAIRTSLDEEQGQLAIDAAGLAVLRNPDSAAAWFYASGAALLLDQPRLALSLMRKSAEHASPTQAAQGRRTLLKYSRAWSCDAATAQALREILGSVEGVQELEEATGSTAGNLDGDDGSAIGDDDGSAIGDD